MADFESLSRSFGDVAEEYERARPGYPDDAIEAAISELGLGPEATALDLAAGTGKLTRQLLPRFARVITVEPLQAMLDVVRRELPAAEAHSGTATAIPLDAASVDVVFVGQAFHWFANHEALAEIDRVLGPGGGVALTWNISPWESHPTEWWRRFDEILHSHSGDARDVRDQTTKNWRAAFEGDQPFLSPQRLDFSHVERLPLSAITDILLSRSYVAALDPPARERMFADIYRHLEHPEAPVADGEITLDYATELYLTRPR